MDYPVLVRRWLAAVRIATGSVFVYVGSGHLLAGWATADGFARAIGGFAKTDPLQAYAAVVGPVVLGAPGIVGPLFVFGFLWTGAWRPYSLDTLLFASLASGHLRGAHAGQGG